MASKPAYEAYLSDNSDSHLEQLFELLRIPSVSSLPEHKGDIQAAAGWVAEKLRTVGVPTVEIMATSGNPVVYGEWIVDPEKPTALIYGHYDVQPPDPLDLWETPPFEPAVRNDRVYARGAADDKGNLFMPILALEALVQTNGAPPVNIKFAFEGEEEVGSPSLPEFVAAQKDLLAADLVLCADGGMWGPDEPSLTVASKGLAGCQVNIKTADTDMHSGMFGASIANAVRSAAELAATLHNPDGSVAIEGFYDTVRPLTDAEKAAFKQVPFDDGEYLESVGATELWGEAGYTALERNWARPTCDLNGIWGGFQGAGIKTVTPCEAHFKITCRLVADQDPQEIVKLIEAHVQKHAPVGATVTVEPLKGSAKPYSLRSDNPGLVAAEEVLGDLYDRDPYITRAGGTLPVAETFQSQLGADLIFYSWGMPDSRAHAPNECFQLKSFKLAPLAYCGLLTKLADTDKASFA